MKNLRGGGIGGEDILSGTISLDRKMVYVEDEVGEVDWTKEERSELNVSVSRGTQSRREYPWRFVARCNLHALALSRESSRSFSEKKKKKKIRFCMLLYVNHQREI